MASDRTSELACIVIMDMNVEVRITLGIRTWSLSQHAANPSPSPPPHPAQSTYLYVSESMQDILGYDPEQLMGTSPWLLFHPDEVEKFEEIR